MVFAASKSASALRTHSAVSFFIKNFAFPHCFSKKPVPFFHPPTKILWRPHKNVQRKGTVNSAGYSARFADLIPGRHNDEQIHIAVLVWFPVGIRSEQDDFVGLEFIRDFPGQSLDGG
jgi:hypothetical protein